MMSEDTTRNFQPSFEERVLNELAAINSRMGSMENRMGSIENRMDSMENRMGSIETRLTSLEDKVDARLRETRPIWEAVQAQLKEIEKQMINFNRQFKMLLQDLFDLRGRVEKLEDSQPIE
jgi:chromosome segregation ATPase